MSFTQTFGGTVIYPSQTTYLSLTMSTDQSLSWPIEQQVSGNIVADIIDVNATTPGLTITIPDARQVSTGYTSLFNNVGANTVSVVDATGGVIVSLASGTAWQAYLRDNTTEAGAWRTFQYGASVSVANAAALAGAGLIAISTTLNQNLPVSSKNINYTVLDADRSRVLNWTAGAGVFTLPTPASVGNGWFVEIKNSGSGDLSLTPAAGLIDLGATRVVPVLGSCLVVTDGSNYYTIGFGSNSGSSTGFDYTTVNVAGSGDFTLSGASLNRIAYRLTGALTGNRNIIVPTAIQEYWINNATTGAFTLSVKTAAGLGITVPTNISDILYCDGTDVVAAQSTGTSFPITIGEGGTGAITAAAARINLGGTTPGIAVFTAASAAAGLAALNGVDATRTITAGTGLTGGGDLSANRTISLSTPVTIANGGTNATTAPSALGNLGAAAQSTTIFAGTGLTGGGDLSTNRTISLVSPVPVLNGGTGATTPAAARLNIGAISPADSTLFTGNNEFQGSGATQPVQVVAGSGIAILVDGNNSASPAVDITNADTGGYLRIKGYIQDSYCKVKASNSTRISTTTVTDDAELSGMVLVPGRYLIRATLIFSASVTSGMGIKYTLFHTGTASTAGFIGIGVVALNTVDSGDLAFASTAGIANLSTTNAFDRVDIVGNITVTNTGNLSIQYAQNSSTANNLNVFTGSYLEARRIS